MKILKEITVWNVPYRQPNHVYMMKGDKIYAYSKWGDGAPEYSKTPLRMDKRGRKFVEVPNTYGFEIPQEQPQGNSWTVKGSKGDSYTVAEENGQWSCTCSGFKFRGQCRHIAEVNQKAA